MPGQLMNRFLLFYIAFYTLFWFYELFSLWDDFKVCFELSESSELFVSAIDVLFL